MTIKELYLNIIQQCKTNVLIGWSSVNFLHSSWYEPVFWIGAGNSPDNTGMF